MPKPRRTGPERITGIIAVVALHVAALHALWDYRILVVPDEVVTLFVGTIATPPPPPPRATPGPARLEKPRPAERPRQLAAEAPAVEAPPARPAGPVALGGDLAVSCPERSAPAYPPLSRRLGEEGKVVLRVELDEQGAVGAAKVATSSGFARLDEAALAAARRWRCTPAQRDGRPARAAALQPFEFVLQ